MTSSQQKGSYERRFTVHDVIIIGSGPAGYTAAAIYRARPTRAARFRGHLVRRCTDDDDRGGELSWFRSGITGPELMDEMREQALRFGADLQMEDVESVALDGPIKEVVTAGARRTGRAVILAMGAAPRYLGVPGEQELLGPRSQFVRHVRRLLLQRSRHRRHRWGRLRYGGSHVPDAVRAQRDLVHRRDEFRASKIMLERARANDKITFLTNTNIVAVEGEGTVTGLRVRKCRQWR